MQNSKFKIQNYNSKFKNRRGAGHRIFNFCVLTFDFERKRSGFGMIEAIVGIALFSVFLFGTAEAGKVAFRIIDDSSMRLQAVFLAEEGLDAVRGMRDAGWAANIASVPLDANRWLLFDGVRWTLTAAETAFIDSRFDRRIQMSSVLRDSNDDIVLAGGTADSGARKVTVAVSWQVRGATTTMAFSTYFTNLFDN